jgi:hypothetical protein
VAAVLKEHVGADAELIEGNRGEFTVWVGEERVAAKDATGYPSEQDILAAVRRALGRA